MAFEYTNLNWLEVAVAAIAGVVIGFVWYMPAVFGKRWAAGAGRELPGPGEVNPAIYLVTIVQALVTAYVLALFIVATGAGSLTDNLVVAFVAWLGFIAMYGLSAVVFERRPIDYYLVNVGYSLVTLLVMAAIFALL